MLMAAVRVVSKHMLRRFEGARACFVMKSREISQALGLQTRHCAGSAVWPPDPSRQLPVSLTKSSETSGDHKFFVTMTMKGHLTMDLKLMRWGCANTHTHTHSSPVAPETPCLPLGGAVVLGTFHCWLENTGSPG